MVPVVLAFVLYVKADEDRAGQVYGQIQDIERGKMSVPEQLSRTNREIVFQQDLTPLPSM